MNGLIRHSVHSGRGGAGGRGGWSGPCGPGRSMSDAPARSRSVTFSSLAASSASVMACRYRRRPFSVNTARHGSPASPGGYTVIPHSTSATTRAESRMDSRVSPLTRARPRPRRVVLPRLGHARPRARAPVVLDFVRGIPVGIGRRVAALWGFCGARKRPLTYLTNRLRHPGNPTSGCSDHSPDNPELPGFAPSRK